MAEMLCACKDELTPHRYVTDKKTYEEGYRCMTCRTFKPLDDEGSFDVQAHYDRMKEEQEYKNKRMNDFHEHVNKKIGGMNNG